MVSLLDIGPLTEEVEIRGKKLTVQGLSAGHLFQLFADFPDMRKLLDAKQGNPQEVFMSLAPELIAKIIAMVTGSPHDKKAEMSAMALGAGDQLTILLAMQRLSFPNGIGPFVDGVTKLMTSTSETLTMTGLPTSSSSTTKSAAAFNASLQMDTPELMRGPARRAN
jgi:hypothetical protein